MAYLIDFLTLYSSAAQKEKVLASSEFKEWKELESQCEVMLARGYFTGESGGLSDPEKLVLKKEERLLDAIWKQYQFIPKEMRYSALGKKSSEYKFFSSCLRNKAAAQLADFSSYPQVKLADIREAAQKLSLMVIPFCYLDVRKMESIMREIRNNYVHAPNIEDSISKIAQYTEQDLYVLCPASLYSLIQVETETESREVIFGGELVRVKALLDTIMQIQRNLFAILGGHEGDTGIWEIGQGGEISENELMHLRVLVETIMPIQRSLLEIARRSKDMGSWEKEMRNNHTHESSEMLQAMSKQISWMGEANQALREYRKQDIKDGRKAAWVIPEATAMTSILFFALPRGTSLLYGDGLARVIKYYGVNMPEEFYFKRGFAQKYDHDEDEYEIDEVKLSL